MTLAASGYISLGGTDANRSVNVELGNSATATLTMPSTSIRTLTGVASGPVVLPNDFWGKSNIVVSLSALTSAYGTAASGTAYAEMVFGSNGGLVENTSDGGTVVSSSWVNSTSVGANYWIRVTQTASYSTTTEYGDSRGAWLQLSSNRTFGVSRTLSGAGGRTYTVQIASDSSGSTIVATATGISLDAEIIV